MAGLEGTFDSLSMFLGDTRNRLHTAGRSDLGRFREQVEREGHGWLEGYMETVLSQASGSKTPYVNLLKTPSRTQTSKKTRATEAAATERAQKLMSVNAKLNGSPVGRSGLDRTALSPLGERALNTASPLPGTSLGVNKKFKSVKVMADPSIRLSPRSAPVRSNVPASPTASAAAKTSRSEAAGRKIVQDKKHITICETDEGREDVNTTAHATVAAPPAEMPTVAPMTTTGTAAQKKRKTPSPGPGETSDSHRSRKNSQPRSTNEDDNAAAERPKSQSSVRESEVNEDKEDGGSSASTGSFKTANATVALTNDAERPEEGVSSNNDEDAVAEPAQSKPVEIPQAPTVITTSATEMDLDIAASIPMPASTSTRTAEPLTAIADVKQAMTDSTSTAVVNTASTETTTSANAPASIAAPAAQPTRQVRSSWLSKALGGNTVPLAANARGSDGSRSSVAHPRQTMADYAALRKSIAQPALATGSTSAPAASDARVSAGSKRKSEVAGLGTDEATSAAKPAQVHEARSEKISRVDTVRARDDEVPMSFANPHHQHAPPASFANAIPSHPTDPAQPNKPPFDRQRSHDIFGRSTMPSSHANNGQTPGVSRKTILPDNATEIPFANRDRRETTAARMVDELREKQLAKDAAKAKAALATSTGAKGGNGGVAKQDKDASAAPVAAPSTGVGSGAGFLRGLGNTLGRSLGLGGGTTSKDAEDAAKKLERELREQREKDEEAEAERKAEEELAAIIRGSELRTPEKERDTRRKLDGRNEIDMDVGAKSPEQVEEEDEAEVLEAVAPGSPMNSASASLASNAITDGRPVQPETVLTTVHAAPTQSSNAHRQESALPLEQATATTATPAMSSAPIPIPTGMHSPNRPRASPPRSMTTGIPIFSPPRAKSQFSVMDTSTTPHGSPGRLVGHGVSRFAAPSQAAAQADTFAQGQGRMYPSLSKIPVSKTGLQDRIRLFEPSDVVAPAAPATEPGHAKATASAKSEEDMDVDRDAASETSDDEDEDEEQEDDDGAEADTASEAEDEDVSMEEEQEEIESPPSPAPRPKASQIIRPGQLHQPKSEAEPVRKTIVIKPPTNPRPPTAASMARSESAFSIASSMTSGRMTASTSTQTGTLGTAKMHADKALGIKPTVGPIKSLQPSKTNAASERRAQIAEDRKKAQAERKADEERKMKEAEQRKREQEREQQERRRRDIEARKKAAMREKEEKEERERMEAEKAARVATAQAQEHERKRKLAAANAQLAKSATVQPLGAKRIVSAASTQGGPPKIKEPVRLTKPVLNASASTGAVPGVKMGPTSFRTGPGVPPAEMPTQQIRAQNGTISLVAQGSSAQYAQNASRPPTLQPVRPSHLSQASQSTHHSNVSALTASNVLAHQRHALASQLEAQAAAIASEDVVLPDIASEYSDSDDSDQGSPAFKRPEWAESPQLREILKRQALRDPDELFGPVQPLNMEELFKAPKNKFRHRTSSANWSRDGLTKGEEEEYARRMGFAGAQGQGQGHAGQGQGHGQRGSVHGPSGLGR